MPDDAPEDEYRLRSPAYFLSDIVTPTFIIEGEHGKHDALQLFKQQLASAPVHVLEIRNADHFDNGDTEARPRLDVTGLANSKILSGLRRWSGEGARTVWEPSSVVGLDRGEQTIVWAHARRAVGCNAADRVPRDAH